MLLRFLLLRLLLLLLQAQRDDFWMVDAVDWAVGQGAFKPWSCWEPDGVNIVLQGQQNAVLGCARMLATGVKGCPSGIGRGGAES